MRRGEIVIKPGQKYGGWSVLESCAPRNLPSGQNKSQWICKCACGVVKAVDSHSLKSRKSSSCGCVKKRRLPKGEAAKRNVFCTYKGKCRRQNIEMKLTENEFFDLMDANCYYCSSPPSNLHHSKGFNGGCYYSGVDRVDNNRGYTKDNVVSSCKDCNLAKRNLTQSDFLKLIERIYNTHLNSPKETINV